MTPVGTQSTLPPSELRDPDLQLSRKLNAELTEIGELLRHSPLNDSLSESIRVWHSQFRDSLKLRQTNIDQIRDTFLDMLESLLCNPISNEPLDDQAWLGGDGHTYGNLFLEEYKLSSSPEYRNRSPLFPQDSRPFTKQPHTIVRELITWIKKPEYRPRFHPPQEEQRYQEIKNKQRQNRISSLLNDYSQSRQRSQIEVETTVNRVAEDVLRNVNQMAASYEAQAAEGIRQLHQRADQIQESDRRAIQVLNERIAELETNITGTEAQNHALKDQIQQMNKDVQAARRADLQLQHNINETRIAIEKQRKRWVKDLAIAVGVVALTAIGTWGLQAMVSTATAGGTTQVAAAVLPRSTPSGPGLFLEVASKF